MLLMIRSSFLCTRRLPKRFLVPSNGQREIDTIVQQVDGLDAKLQKRAFSLCIKTFDTIAA